MATIIQKNGDDYLLTFSQPETAWITMIAKSLGMTKETVVGAAINQGLTHYVGMLSEIAEHELKKTHEGHDKPIGGIGVPNNDT